MHEDAMTQDQRGEARAREAARHMLRMAHAIRQNPRLARDPERAQGTYAARVDLVRRALRVHHELRALELGVHALPLDARALYEAMRLRIDRILSTPDHVETNDEREAA